LAHAYALTSALALNVVSAADAAIAVPLPPLNADADAAAAALPHLVVIHCRTHHLESIFVSAIFPCCLSLAAALLLPLSTAMEYHSSPLPQR
jgi:hypothetical protein